MTVADSFLPETFCETWKMRGVECRWIPQGVGTELAAVAAIADGVHVGQVHHGVVKRVLKVSVSNE